MPKFRFKSARKNKFNFTVDKEELLSTQIIKGAHIEFFSNIKMIIEGCKAIVDYQNNYIKLKLKKGYVSIIGTDFLISTFENEKIIINGNIISFEFLV